MRPFWVVQPSARDCETCLRKLHENSRLIIIMLIRLKFLPPESSSVGVCVDKMVCEAAIEDCYTGKCSHCLNKINLLLMYGEFDGDGATKWNQ